MTSPNTDAPVAEEDLKTEKREEESDEMGGVIYVLPKPRSGDRVPVLVCYSVRKLGGLYRRWRYGESHEALWEL